MDVTLFVTLLSAYALLLADFAGQRDMVIGTPVRGRNSSEVEGLMGYFTNLLPLRMEIDPAQPFSELVRKVRDVVLDSFSAPDIRLEDLTRELSLRSEGGGSMLYQALFSFRSEEHTSELQSLMRISYAVFCLKKKTQYKKQSDTSTRVMKQI